MKICFFGIYDPEYSRNRILLDGLRQNGAEVIEVREDWRDPKRYRKLWKSLRDLDNEYDFIYAAYPSPMPTILARLISKRPVVSDAFYSMYDSVVNDRRKAPWYHPWAIKLAVLDWLGIMMAHLVIADTEEHKKYWKSWLGAARIKAAVVYIGFNERIFRPTPAPAKKDTLVLFHGSFVPLQGVGKIVEAARLCAGDASIRFKFVGNGRDYGLARDLAARYGLGNIEFIGSVPFSAVNAYLAEADIVLGIFGDTAKAIRVIPNKVYEGLAAKKAIITMDSPAMREIFSDADLVYVKNSAEALASAIQSLARDPARRGAHAEQGYATIQGYAPKAIGTALLKAISASAF